MKHVKVDATTSTNETAKALRKNGFSENFCISAEYQTSGKGQHQKKWMSERSKNLLFTVALGKLKLLADQRFYLNILVCNALFEVLKTYQLKHIQIKWPNDILAEQQKIGGILIENTLTGNYITSSFIGIGLNVNQDTFNDLPKASSMKLLLNKALDRHAILNRILDRLEKIPVKLAKNTFEDDIRIYKDQLFGYHSTTAFYLRDRVVIGKLLDVETSGELLIEFEDGTVKTFSHSEVQQIY